ncbi:hypothetical protein OUZ56_028763 [Daphnia magna]|uniref:Uncharacterized protein n=1 Tax=Daphnia magna TaxID=35525 RepID=A0ABR0B4U8_9CRUS|nr:hypothetical protein OUZ56_028763 [Daphnia magna]
MTWGFKTRWWLWTVINFPKRCCTRTFNIDVHTPRLYDCYTVRFCDDRTMLRANSKRTAASCSSAVQIQPTGLHGFRLDCGQFESIFDTQGHNSNDCQQLQSSFRPKMMLAFEHIAESDQAFYAIGHVIQCTQCIVAVVLAVYFFRPLLSEHGTSSLSPRLSLRVSLSVSTTVTATLRSREAETV